MQQLASYNQKRTSQTIRFCGREGVLSVFKHPKYRIRKNCVDMCVRHGREAIEICLLEKGVLAKKRLGTLL